MSRLFSTLLASAALLCAVAQPAMAADNTVNVLYAGSLTNAMEHSIGPAFTHASGVKFAGYAGGSTGLANQIKGKLRRGDVFISAAPAVNTSLTGAGNGGWVSWYATFGQSPLVIGYAPSSRYANDLKTKRWDQALLTPGIRIGRTDPKLDPKGALTVKLVEHAAELYKEPDLVKQMLGAPNNPAQVLPEETLVGRLQSGQVDAGFFYSTETSDAHIPALSLPPELHAQAVYTITVLNHAPNKSGAAKFVSFLLGPRGRALLAQHGIDVVTPVVTGNAADVPASLKPVLAAAK